MTIEQWRKGFRDYAAVRGEISDITDSDGGVITFDEGKPVWDENLVLQEACGGVKICLRMCGLVCEEDEKEIFKFICGYAAHMGMFHVEIDLEVVNDNGAAYTVEAKATILDPPEGMLCVCSEEGEFFIVGNPTTGLFAHFKGDDFGDGCYIDVTDPMQAEKFDTYEDAARALVEDEDLRIWMDEQKYAEDVRPLKVHKTVKVTTK